VQVTGHWVVWVQINVFLETRMKHIGHWWQSVSGERFEAGNGRKKGSSRAACVLFLFLMYLMITSVIQAKWRQMVRWSMNNELKNMWTKALLMWLDVISRHFAVQTEGNHKNRTHLSLNDLLSIFDPDSHKRQVTNTRSMLRGVGALCYNTTGLVPAF